jgi:oligopeptide transport system substrate-binding protein
MRWTSPLKPIHHQARRANKDQCRNFLIIVLNSGLMTRYLTILLTIVILDACNSPYEDNSSLTVFRYNEFSNITSLDPAFAKDQANIWACNQLYNGLLQLDDQLQICACIAKDWQVDSSGTIYTFSLRTDVFFHDHPAFTEGKGRSVKAGDFVFSFNRLMDPAFASPGTWVFSKVARNDGGYDFKALNDSTLQIGLAEPFPPFAGILTMIYCSVIPEEVMNDPGNDFRKYPVGTGPFRFKTWKENVKLVLVKNERYFETDRGNSLPYLDAVAITFLVDKQSAFLEFVKGNLDFMSGLDQSYKDELLTKDGRLREKYAGRFNLMTQPFLNTEYLGILVDTNLEIVKNSPLRHKEFRQAINCGFDRRKMIRYLRNNIGYPGTFGIIPPGLPAFDTTLKAYKYDPAKARQLVKEAGYEDADQIPEITLHTTAEYVDLFKYLQHELGEIGIPVKIEVNPAATLMQMKAFSKVNFFRASWIADYPDEENYLSLFTGANMAPAGPNYSHFHSRLYDSLYDKSQKTVHEDERIQLYKQMNQVIMEDAPVVILYYDQVLRFTQKNIHNLDSNPLNLLSLKRVIKTIPVNETP